MMQACVSRPGRLGAGLAALVLLVSGLHAPVSAAQIETMTLRDSPRNWLRIGRAIAPGDERTFHDLAASAPGAVVVLSGPGGSLLAALAIGKEIQERQLSTLVPADAECASACSLIWLAGSRRMLAKGARIGFHAASLGRSDGSRVETHEFDGLLRSYLNSLGFAADATATIVATHSAFVRWLDPIELRANGIPSEPYP
jgi:hypothetical protein